MRERRATVTIFFAIWSLIIFGLAAVGVDGGYWYVMRRQVQNAADAAAIAGVNALAWGNSTVTTAQAVQLTVQQIVNGGLALATDNGIGSNATVTINGYANAGAVPGSITANPGPTTGPYAGNASAVEAIIQQPANGLLSSLIEGLAGIRGPTIAARAVALLANGKDNACVLALTGTVQLYGSSTNTASNCIIASNDTVNPAVYTQGNTTVTAYTLYATGVVDTSGGTATLLVPALSNQLPMTNPFASADSLTSAVFNSNSPVSPRQNGQVTVNKTTGITTYTPGYYSNGVSINGQGTYVFSPGLYVIDGNGNQGLTINGGNNASTAANVTCSGCTFVVINGASIKINGNTNINFTADSSLESTSTIPNISALDDILFYTAPAAGVASSVTINGGANDYFTGAMYFPGVDASVNGNDNGAGTPLTKCFVVVAGSVSLGGSSQTDIQSSGCTNFGNGGKARFAQLVE